MGTKLKPREYKLRRVLLATLNVLRQPRKTFDGLEELAEDIFLKGGMLMAPIVAEFKTGEQLRVYLEAVNNVYGTAYTPETLIACTEGGTYHVLLAGERRTRAYRLLVEAERAEPWYWADVRIDIDPVQALEIQLSENTHRAVPPHEEADAIDRLYRFEKGRGRITLAAFAHKVGRSPQWIRNALRFCDLPEPIQTLVRQGDLSYGSAVELARLRRAGFDDERLVDWAVTALVSRLSFSDTRARVQHMLSELEHGQTSLLGLLEGEQQKQERAMARRKTVEGHAIRTHIENAHYLLLVLRLFEQGLLGSAESPYALGSPRRHAHRTLTLLAELSEHLLTVRGKVPSEVQSELEQCERILRE